MTRLCDLVISLWLAKYFTIVLETNKCVWLEYLTTEGNDSRYQNVLDLSRKTNWKWLICITFCLLNEFSAILVLWDFLESILRFPDVVRCLCGNEICWITMAEQFTISYFADYNVQYTIIVQFLCKNLILDYIQQNEWYFFR